MARTRWLRLVLFSTAAFVTVLIGGLVVLWFALPSILTSQATKAALQAGFEEASIEVDRADLFGLRIANLQLRRGGLQVAVDRAEADYSIGELVGGRVGKVRIHGLEVVLDFTLPRRALLPDAVEDLLAQVPESDDPLVWPVDRFEFDESHLVLVLPEGEESFSVSGEAAKGDDGRVAFSLDSTHPQQELHVDGTMRTETLDGGIEVKHASLTPAFLVGLLKRLGIFELPTDVALETNRVEMSGQLTLKSGAIDSFSSSVRAPSLAANIGEIEAAINDLTIDGARDVDGNLTATLKGLLAAAQTGADAAWSVGTALVEAALDRGHLHATLAPTVAKWGDDASAQLTLDVDAGIPALGGEPKGIATLAIGEGRYGNLALAPLTITVSGWSDRLDVAISELMLADESPAALTNLTAAITDPLGAARNVEIAASIVAHEALAGFLPPGWKLVEPVLPTEAFRLNAKVAWSDAGPGGEVVFQGRLPQLRLAADDKGFSSASTFELQAIIDSTGLAASGTIALSEIETDLPRFIPGVKAIGFGVEVPRISYVALGELASGRVPREDVTLKLKGTVAESQTRGYAYLDVQHFGATSDWTAEAWMMLDDLDGTWAGTKLTDTRIELTMKSGRLPDARIGEWLDAQEIVPLVRSVLPLVRLDLSVTANSIERPGRARADWSGLWIQKPPAAPDAAPLVATATAHSGVMRVGLETIEQPSLKLEVLGDLEALEVKTAFRGNIEGTKLAIDDTEKITVDLADLSARGEGSFVLHPFTLEQSDIVSRWVAAAKGISIGATASAIGTLKWSTTGEWDGTAEIKMSEGLFDYPDQKLRVEGIATHIVLTSLKDFRTMRGQPMSFARFALGDVEVTNGAFRFATDGAHRVVFDGATARIFGGDVAVGSFALVFPAPDVGIELEFDGLDAEQLARQIKIFRGTLTGRLRGRLPLGLLAGKPVVGEGYLELDPRVPSSFSVDARGLFTTDVPNHTTIEKLSRLPYELAEEALSEVSIKTLRIDLFKKDLPETPIRLEFSGESVTPRARVPVHIVTNVNGSLSQALDFLMRLATL